MLITFFVWNKICKVHNKITASDFTSEIFQIPAVIIDSGFGVFLLQSAQIAHTRQVAQPGSVFLRTNEPVSKFL